MSIGTLESVTNASRETLSVEQAALRAVAYADVFDYPLHAAEIHEYLHGVAAPWAATTAALERCVAPGGPLIAEEGFYMLRGRENLVQLRRSRAMQAARLWPAAVWYGRLMAGLPFVRMVAVTGSLAWDNVDGSADIDYLVVTEPGRLWLCRWLLAAIARIARRSRISLCINYVLSERALVLQERDLYTACELVRMTPIAGLAVYRQMRALNDWTAAYLPNAPAVRPEADSDSFSARSGFARLVVRAARAGEWVLRSRAGAVLEWLEMKYRHQRRLRQNQSKMESGEPIEALYTPDSFKTHYSGHRWRTLSAFWQRLQALGAGAP